jgi:hypothetical protein
LEPSVFVSQGVHGFKERFKRFRIFYEEGEKEGKGIQEGLHVGRCSEYSMQKVGERPKGIK